MVVFRFKKKSPLHQHKCLEVSCKAFDVSRIILPIYHNVNIIDAQILSFAKFH